MNNKGWETNQIAHVNSRESPISVNSFSPAAPSILLPQIMSCRTASSISAPAAPGMARVGRRNAPIMRSACHGYSVSGERRDGAPITRPLPTPNFRKCCSGVSLVVQHEGGGDEAVKEDFGATGGDGRACCCRPRLRRQAKEATRESKPYVRVFPRKFGRNNDEDRVFRSAWEERKSRWRGIGWQLSAAVSSR